MLAMKSLNSLLKHQSSSNTHCASTRHHLQNSVFRVHLSKGQKDGRQRVQNQDCTKDEGEQSTQLLQLPPLYTDWCGVWHCHVGGGLDSSSCLAIPFKFTVLTAHIALH